MSPGPEASTDLVTRGLSTGLTRAGRKAFDERLPNGGPGTQGRRDSVKQREGRGPGRMPGPRPSVHHGGGATRSLGVSPCAYAFSESAAGPNWCRRNAPVQAIRSEGT